MGRGVYIKEMTTLSIIGAGNLGTTLGAALKQRGYLIRALSCLTQAESEHSHRIIGEGTALTDNFRAAAGSQMVFITVPDDSVVHVAEELAGSDQDWTGVCFFHCSGLLTSAALKSLGNRGAHIASLHPVQSFAEKSADGTIFKGIFFGLEGTPGAMESAEKLVKDLGGQSIHLFPEEKPIYHAACSMASNLLVPLLYQAAELLPMAGMPDSKKKEILLPLIQGTLQNVKKFDAASALTGPIARGDKKSVQLHLKALQDHPQALRTYSLLGRAALEIVWNNKRISRPTYEQIKALLAGK